MILSSTNIDIREDDRLEGPAVTFTFKGKFTQQASELSTRAWKKHFNDQPHTKFILIWDCMEMTGFEMSARREWIKYLQILSNRIDRVIVISDNIIIRGSARLMLKLFSFKSETYDSHREVWDSYPNYV